MDRVHAYRLYPSPSQGRRWGSIGEPCRRFYHDPLAERCSAWEQEQCRVGKVEPLRRGKLRKAENPYARDVHSHILPVVVADLDQALPAFFRRVRAGEKPGYPRFPGRNRFSSFGLQEYGNGFPIDGCRLHLHGVGRVAVRWHRSLPSTPKTVRILRKADGWYAMFPCEVEPQPLAARGREVGVDVGISSVIATSEGQTAGNPKWYRAAQRKFRVQKRRARRRMRGSSNRRKAIQVLASQHLHVSRQRQDFLNQRVHEQVTDYDFLAIERREVRNRVKNRCLSKSIMDSGWGYFRSRLHAQAAEAGRGVIEVDPAYTSQTGSSCGERFSEPIDLSVLFCPCGMVSRSRCKCRPEYPSAGTQPLGAGFCGGKGSPRSRRAFARAERHSLHRGWKG